MRCPACGVEVVEEGVFCHQCGERLTVAGDRLPGDSDPAGDLASRATNAFARGFGSRRGGAEPAEEDLWRGGYSSKAMIGAWVASGLISLVALGGGIVWARSVRWWLVAIGAAILPWLYYLAVLGYRRMSVRYALTTQRFMHERGILRRVNDRIEVLDMDDVTYEQGLLERLVGVGTIRIVSTDRSHPEIALPGIENVAHVAAILDNARLAERRRRGVHIEQI